MRKDSASIMVISLTRPAFSGSGCNAKPFSTIPQALRSCGLPGQTQPHILLTLDAVANHQLITSASMMCLGYMLLGLLAP
jgi:hypothetical protein